MRILSEIIRNIKLLRCKLILLKKKNITIGKNTTFGRGTVFYSPNRMRIGNNVYIGKYCSFEADIEISDDVLFGNNVGLIGKYDHDYSYIGKSIKDSPWIGDFNYNFKGKNLKIIIERDTWVGYGATIVSGVRVGRGSIIAAGSVVLKDVEPYTIVAGNPAKKVSNRFTASQIEEHESFYGKNKSGELKE
ncbi:acyltransferase [Fictibacillus enclensis]|uniref:acyltransferase n=1 Tax=Fictibacillus enclensis TaxID=1017270 RepID=UPI0024BFF233|nr:DapH/DapD/GlmU-related protein [Fictibacillus enclensis]WHY71995.1 DapH/DapD/GlmU-related protein [Fictibacillus enclensis]